MYADVRTGECYQCSDYPYPVELFTIAAAERVCGCKTAACMAGGKGQGACIRELGREHYRKPFYLCEGAGARHKIFENNVVDEQRCQEAECQLYSVSASLFENEKRHCRDYPYPTGVADNREKCHYRIGYRIAKLLEKQQYICVDSVEHIWLSAPLPFGGSIYRKAEFCNACSGAVEMFYKIQYNL